MLIKLTQGQYAIIDDEDYAFINQWKWYFNNGGYAVRDIRVNGKRTALYMHRFIMNTPKNMDTDHRDGNTLNNKRINLRVCTHAENLWNQKVSIKGTSKYRGVYFEKSRLQWSANISSKDRTIHLGRFNNEVDAARAYNEKAKELRGEFAILNVLL